MGLKATVVGGGSTYTPELVEGFARRAAVLPIDELVLLDPDGARLEVVGGLAQRILAREGWPGRLTLTSDRSAALDGATFTLVQLRVGGQAARRVDETLPHRFGTIGQETTGPGGFAKALRTVPLVLEIAEEAARRGAADAWLLDFTNPVGIVTQALLDRGFRAIGLCNVAIGFQRSFAQRFGVSPDRVRLDHVGLNHLSWIRRVWVDGEDRLPELLEAGDPMVTPGDHFSLALVRALGAVPSYYLRYYYAPADALREQLDGASRAEDVMSIERELLELYRDPALDRKPELLERRGGAYYSEAAAALIESLHTGDGAVHAVNVRNDGAIPGIADDDVVELSATVDRDGATAIPTEPLSHEMRALVLHAKEYERLAIEAALSGDDEVALRALLANPLVPGAAAAEGLRDALIEANLPYLPRFVARGEPATADR
ncbi:MAG TPA: 6-phospho-beta-glucosidase [Candidatus Limnocylindrales bacterium]|nr:6-phospho-beta-glucosidase [Candidatus Limnocylindrales bacterium]